MNEVVSGTLQDVRSHPARAGGVDGVSEKLFLMWNDSGGYSLLERGGVCCELSS